MDYKNECIYLDKKFKSLFDYFNRKHPLEMNDWLNVRYGIATKKEDYNAKLNAELETA